jgi:hypothetical protein
MIRYCKTQSLYMALLIVAAGLTSCQTGSTIKLPKPVRVNFSDEAATVLVTPSMVAPWSYIETALKPNFTMTGDTAVTEVLPTTEQVQSQVLNALGVSLGVGLPGSSTSSSNLQTATTAKGSNTTGAVTTTTASSNGTTNDTTTTTITPGVAPVVPTGTPAAASLPTAPALTGGLSLDPVLKYKAATYLNQEVQLLNQEIDNAAVRECFVPYVVKLKLAVMNYQPYLAYSIHTRISFGPSGGVPPELSAAVIQAAQTLQDAGISLEADLEPPEKSTGPISDSNVEEGRRYDALQLMRTTYMAPRCALKNHSPVVVPFLVADDMEVALKSRASEAAQQIAMALNAMAHGVGGNAGLNYVAQTLNAITSQDLSSALTVARDNDNTLYIRIAPNNQASDEPSLVGQTYDVAVLLLIPRRYFLRRGDELEPPRISLVSYTQFRDATSGKILPGQPPANEVANLKEVMTPYLGTHSDAWLKLPDTAKLESTKALMRAIKHGNLEEFRSYLKGGSECSEPMPNNSVCFIAADIAPALWAGLSSVLSDDAYKSASFEAPVPAKITIPTHTVLAADDKVHPIQVLIGGVGGSSIATLAASLHVAIQSDPADKKMPPVSTSVAIPAQTLALDSVAHVLTLTFPSLGKTGLAMPVPPPKGAAATPLTGPYIVPDVKKNAVIIERVNCDPYKELCPALEDANVAQPAFDATVKPSLSLPLQWVSMPKPPNGTNTSLATLAAAGNVISIARGTSMGVLPITVNLADSVPPNKDTMAVTATGAPIASAFDANGKSLNLGKHGYVLSAAGAYTLNFVNLVPGDNVTVSVQPIKPDNKTLDGDPVTATYTAVPIDPSRP